MDKYENDIINMFDAYCKMVINSELKNHRIAKIKENEKMFLTAPETILNNLSNFDKNYTNFKISINGYEIFISNDILYETLLELNTDEFLIIFMFYFLEYNDNFISNELDIPRRSINYKRHKILEKLKTIMKEKERNND